MYSILGRVKLARKPLCRCAFAARSKLRRGNLPNRVGSIQRLLGVLVAPMDTDVETDGCMGRINLRKLAMAEPAPANF